MKRRITNQYQYIHDYLMSVHTHPTADEIYHAIQKDLPRISLATVYRNLKKMVKNGDAIQCTHKNITHYDANIMEHHHFICRTCNTIYDIDKHAVTLNKNVLKKSMDAEVIRYESYIYGICKKCN